MKEAVEILRAHAVQVSGENPQHPDLPGIERMVTFGENWDSQQAGSEKPSVLSAPREQLLSREEELEREWVRQAKGLANVFSDELGVTPAQYIHGLPEFPAQPEEHRGRLDLPIIVEARVPLERTLTLVGIHHNPEIAIEDWRLGRFVTPKKNPYSVWLDDGRKTIGKSANDVRYDLASDERGGTVFEAVALYLRDPRVLSSHYLNCPGSQDQFATDMRGERRVPCLEFDNYVGPILESRYTYYKGERILSHSVRVGSIVSARF